jgi:hypothetical protein
MSADVGLAKAWHQARIRSHLVSCAFFRHSRTATPPPPPPPPPAVSECTRSFRIASLNDITMDSSSDTDMSPTPNKSAEHIPNNGSFRDHFSNLPSDRDASRLTVQTDLFGRVDFISDNEEDLVLSRWVKTDSVDTNIVERIKTKLTGEAKRYLETLRDVCTRSYEKYQKEDRKRDTENGTKRATVRETDMYAPLASVHPMSVGTQR